MYTSIEEFLKAKNAAASQKTNETKVAANVESKNNNVSEIDRETKKLAKLLERITYCHFILDKGLINESASLSSINEAISNEFGLDNFFKNEEQFNSYYTKTIASMKRFVEEAQMELDNDDNDDNDDDNNNNGEETNEIFGFSKKKYILKSYDGSKSSQEFVNSPARKAAMKIYTDAFTKAGLQPEYIKAAVMATYDFAGGIPQLSKYDFTYDADTTELTINPNKGGVGGLFNGHPIMG